MKKAGSGAVVAMLLGCTAMLGAQSGSTTNGGATDRRGSTPATTPDQGSPRGTAGQSGSTTRTDQTDTSQSGAKSAS